MHCTLRERSEPGPEGRRQVAERRARRKRANEE